jgi:hypothetical protein
MIPVASRYLNKEDFTRKSVVANPFTPTDADLVIMKDKDPNFRVLNLTVSTFQDAHTSYFHKSIGGYHGAKLRRYQEIIDHHIVESNMKVLNMLNTKYLIVPGSNRKPEIQINWDALGNAWFVNNLRIVENADEEINALNTFEPAEIAILDKRFANHVANFTPVKDTAADINLTSYAPNHLKYKSTSTTDQLAVFSEIFYDKGWKSYIDGKEVPHFRVNYILRAMIIPAGSHEVEFKFEPAVFKIGNVIAAASSILVILMLIGYIVLEVRQKRTDLK